MKLNRKMTNIMRNIFDDWIPPVIRDSRWFMEIPLRIVFGRNYKFYMDFKREAGKLNEKEFIKAYEKLDTLLKDRETDLSEGSEKLIRSNIYGKTVLDAGCGKGYLAVKLSGKYDVTAIDMVENRILQKKYAQIKWVKGNIERLPFANNSFDTVVCAHTLEHVLDIQKAISELRRVTKERVIIVVPKQRPYHYTFDLHLHFFPYIHTFQTLMGGKKNSSCMEIDGDLFYMEDKE